MTRQEVKDLLEIVFLYRPFYKQTLKDESDFKRCIDEWEDKLKNYENEEVKNNLSEFLKDNESKIPTPFDLTRELKTIEQKNRKGRTYIYCEVCHMPLEIYIDHERHKVDRKDADKHMDRCRSVRHLKLMYTKYLGREIPIDEEKNLKKMSEDKFDEVYYLILKKAYEKMPDNMEKHFTKMALESAGKL